MQNKRVDTDTSHKTLAMPIIEWAPTWRLTQVLFICGAGGRGVLMVVSTMPYVAGLKLRGSAGEGEG